ncbi:hypothetical protein [Sphingomonas sp.]
MGLRPDRLALGAAALWALAVPIWALSDRAHQLSTPSPAVIADTPPPTMALALERPLFGAVEAEAEAEAAGDAPQLLGIAGRLNRDAVALVRAGDGATRSMAPGERVDGWRLESLSADAALFRRGNRRARVALSDQ